MKVTLTRPDGSLVYFVNGAVIRPSPKEWAIKGAPTEIAYGGVTRFVREEQEAVVKAFEDNGKESSK